MNSGRNGHRSDVFDLVVVGSGVAGLTAALAGTAEGARLSVLTKGRLHASASYEAQGGIAAAVASGDSPEQHAADTLAAGRGLCRESAVRVLTEEAAARVAELRRLGVRFDDRPRLEGGHSRRRVLHVDGAETGRGITEALTKRVLGNPFIEVFEQERVALEPGHGCLTEHGEVRADAIVLATGGYAALWSRTTNPPSSVGDGVALAYRAGASIADLEFVQFHPTTLAGRRLLLSEALRGEGAQLVDHQGERLVDELAPRDVVARAVAQREAFLDLRPIEHRRFPRLMTRLRGEGYDPRRDPLPVSAAAHYTMGGVATDLDGRTDIPGLYAAGECACTGVHGANRLASNAPLECLVFGRRAALTALAELGQSSGIHAGTTVTDRLTEALRQQVWTDAGLVRHATRLERLRTAPILLARLVAQSALARTESRGCHLRADHPYEDPHLTDHHTVLRPGSPPVLERWT